MNQLNSIILEGNITRDVVFKETPHGCKVCTIPLAVNRWYKSGDGKGVEEVSYFDVEAFGKMAEYCEKRVTKGRGIRVVGRLKQSRWKGADGKNTSRVTIIAEHIEFKPQVGQRTDSNAELAGIAEATAASAEEFDRMDMEEAAVF